MENVHLMLKEAVLLGVILLLGWWAIYFKNKLLTKVKTDRFTVEVVSKILTIFIVLISLMMALQVFGLDIVPLVTLSGVGAAILGFASKDVFANFFAGGMVYVTRPFLVGDFVEVPGKKISGHVEEIGWYLTTLRDAQKRVISVPNSTFTTEFLLNHSRITHRKIEEKVRLKVTAPQTIEEIIGRVRGLLRENAEIDQSEEINVFLLSIGAYGCEIEVKAYAKTIELAPYMELKQQVLLDIHKIAGPV